MVLFKKKKVARIFTGNGTFGSYFYSIFHCIGFKSLFSELVMFRRFSANMFHIVSVGIESNDRFFHFSDIVLNHFLDSLIRELRIIVKYADN